MYLGGGQIIISVVLQSRVNEIPFLVLSNLYQSVCPTYFFHPRPMLEFLAYNTCSKGYLKHCSVYR